MTDFISGIIKKKQDALKALEERNAKAETVEELRSIGAQIMSVKDEIADAQAELVRMESESKVEERGLDPLASYGQGKATLRQDDVDPLATMEYRTAFMNYVQKGIKSDVLQYRADDQNESGDLGVLMPSTVIQSIMKETEKVYGQLYSQVKKTNIKGGVKYPIGSFNAVFNRINENGAPTDRQNAGSVTGYVEFSYNLGEIRIAQTLLANVLSVPVFEAELAKTIVEAYVKAMDVEILSGVSASNQMEGILTEAAKSSSRIATANIIEFTAEEMLDWKSWQKKLFAKIPLSMRNMRPKFVMTANTWESNIMTLVDDNNRPVYRETYNPETGDERATFKGREVTFIEEGIGIYNFDDATSGQYFGIYWVPEMAYAINTNMEFFVKRYFDDEKNQWVDKALVINDGKVLDPKYIYLLRKSVATA